MPTVMITGAAGFTGRRAAAEAARRGAALTLMSHHRTLERPGPGPMRSVRADLADPDSLRGVCEGVDVLLHCASLIGGTPQDSHTVNARGTAALVAEAQRSGVSRIVYLSTASVYGRGVFRGALPADLERRPRSATSRTRALAEDAVLAAGGFVLRPYLVYGPGDAWVVPGLVRLLHALAGGTSGWDARLSVISVTELAGLLVGVGLAPRERLSASLYHAALPAPVEASQLLGAVAAAAGVAPAPETTPAAARLRLRGDREAANALEMVATDHWFDSTPVWADLGHTVPGTPADVHLPRLREWYARRAAASVGRTAGRSASDGCGGPRPTGVVAATSPVVPGGHGHRLPVRRGS
ncbi:NAD-dependent epimerase/dehydratase family protein [Streptomyces griseiscabiei]|uniref:NAD-dependent epimerase/dehydratase family protein n=1 Tax=Streptomyces griseiscabiei TaxID=2993540 RepID=A0ABU4LJ66_9ACTN|nr:NAD-dependent epimerase/dehydratase family protein [Streptomyces griseiscabiei]MDX2915285.1 NAD-dependent epimerase/dehydratase family protein [Streptomyces griseiscabiei]